MRQRTDRDHLQHYARSMEIVSHGTPRMPTLTSDARIRVKHALQTGLREPPPTFCALTGRLHESIDLKTTQKTITWLAAALVLLAAGIAYNFWSYQQISEASTQRYHTRNVIGMASDLLLDLKDA